MSLWNSSHGILSSNVYLWVELRFRTHFLRFNSIYSMKIDGMWMCAIVWTVTISKNQTQPTQALQFVLFLSIVTVHNNWTTFSFLFVQFFCVFSDLFFSLFSLDRPFVYSIFASMRYLFLLGVFPASAEYCAHFGFINSISINQKKQALLSFGFLFYAEQAQLMCNWLINSHKYSLTWAGRTVSVRHLLTQICQHIFTQAVCMLCVNICQ